MQRSIFFKKIPYSLSSMFRLHDQTSTTKVFINVCHWQPDSVTSWTTASPPDSNSRAMKRTKFFAIDTPPRAHIRQRRSWGPDTPCYSFDSATLSPTTPQARLSTWVKVKTCFQDYCGRAWLFSILFKVLDQFWIFDMVVLPFRLPGDTLTRRSPFLTVHWAPATATPHNRRRRIIPPGIFNISVSGRYIPEDDLTEHFDEFWA